MHQTLFIFPFSSYCQFRYFKGIWFEMIDEYCNDVCHLPRITRRKAYIGLVLRTLTIRQYRSRGYHSFVMVCFCGFGSNSIFFSLWHYWILIAEVLLTKIIKIQSRRMKRCVSSFVHRIVLNLKGEKKKPHQLDNEWSKAIDSILSAYNYHLVVFVFQSSVDCQNYWSTFLFLLFASVVNVLFDTKAYVSLLYFLLLPPF